MSETTITLLRDTWAVVLEAMGDDMPQASAKIAAAIESQCADWGEVVHIAAAIPGWRKVAETIGMDPRLMDVAYMIQRQCEAATWRAKAEKSGL